MQKPLTAVHNSFFALLLFFTLLISFPLGTQAQLVPERQKDEQVPDWGEDRFGRRTPRGTISGFINAVAEKDYEKAGNFLNMEQASVEADGQELSRVLEKFLDRRGQIFPYSWISADMGGRIDDDLPPSLDRVGSISAEGETIDLYVEETKDENGAPVWLISSATIEKLHAIRDLSDTNMLIDRIMPPVLENYEWGGVSVGQWLMMVLLAALSYLLAWSFLKILFYLVPKIYSKAGEEPAAGIIKAFGLPIRLYLAVWLLVYLSQEVGISIIVRQKFSGITLVIGWLAFLILLWRLSEFISRFSQHRMNLRGNISGLSVVLFLQRAAKVAIVIVGIIAILGAVGVDVTTGLAALGIGGIALALGAQKTIENFVGSVTVITDQPVRVGDFCKVGNTMGTVEKIGMRSTRIRTLDRTLVTIPNGQFSSENIENYAHRDKFRFYSILGLRYETSPEQIRYLLVELRSALYAHPLVSPDPARVRFVGLGADSLQLEIFAFITVATYDEFLEVREDLLLQMMDIVGESGTGFAFPSQTIYFGRDSGLSSEKTQHAEEKVKEWRKKGELQIPKFDPEKVEELKGKSTYPPEGSAQQKNESSGRIPGL
ncbi:MscS family membrane protein [Salinimicrobium catena]|uniref:MscS family membrane protein n=1 Tax=Salinimicrobium catena TaxID=390640 RepID=A0A1H5NNX7_9FLAO|nr:mechanosensitive ion channel family protein [Salinimicrobium catena]SDL56105.1 MscS family membrane protein [Salinimicrobium catena]SEF03253.1 MscS family membrane protein [Salinimicrobium catena]